MKYDVLELAKNITPLDENAVIAAKNRQNELLKPPGALGVLEEISGGMSEEERFAFYRSLTIISNSLETVANKTEGETQ